MIRAWLAVSLLGIATAARAETPPEVLDLFRDAALAMANDDSAGFLDQFDREMPNYAALREQIEDLLGASQVSSTIDVVSDEGDARKRTLDLDWLLILNEKNEIGSQKASRRGVVRCTVERLGKHWKITSIAPVEFFRPD